MYTSNYIEDLLAEKGELIVTLESDAYPEVELHNHDTSVNHATDEVTLDLSDGTFCFNVGAIESVAWHQQSTDDLGL
jgi:hypothetical protein